MLRVQDYFFHQSSHTTPQNIVSQTHNYDQQPAKIRYIAGMCVGRALASSISYVCEHCHDESALVNEHKQRVRSLQGSLYNTLTIAKEETAHPASLLEIEHRQFKYGHLTIVNDDLFSIFIQYDKIVHQNISTKWSAEDKHNFFNTVFHSCVTELYQDTSPILEVLNSKVMRPPLLTYLRTCYKEIGLRINSAYSACKKLAHRKQVLLEEANVHASSSQTSHPPVQSTTSTAVNDSSITSASLSTTMSSNRKRGMEGTIDPNTCSVCSKQWTSKCRLLWIECTECGAWLHRKCDTTLRSRIKWKKVTAQGAQYPCPMCQKKVNNFSKITLCKAQLHINASTYHLLLIQAC